MSIATKRHPPPPSAKPRPPSPPSSLKTATDAHLPARLRRQFRPFLRILAIARAFVYGLAYAYDHLPKTPKPHAPNHSTTKPHQHPKYPYANQPPTIATHHRLRPQPHQPSQTATSNICPASSQTNTYYYNTASHTVTPHPLTTNADQTKPHQTSTCTTTTTTQTAGHWPSRDPIGERGGVNLYGFVGNDGVGSIDLDDLSGIDVKYTGRHGGSYDCGKDSIWSSVNFRADGLRRSIAYTQGLRTGPNR